MKITVVIPVLNERPTLERLVQDISEHIAPHRYRILFIDDGSTDGSWDEIVRLQKSYAHVEGLRFERNHGKTAALAAGFAAADGDCVLMMDADLQDDPAEIPRLVEKLEHGFDVVGGWKENRHDPWHKTLPSRVFNRSVGAVFGFDLRDINTGYKLMRLPVAKGLRMFDEMHRMVAVQAHEQGYRVAEIPVTHHPRRFGKSKYGLERFYRGIRDAFTVWLMYRCKIGPARFFGRAAARFFGVALVILLAGWGAGQFVPIEYRGAAWLWGAFTALVLSASVIMAWGLLWLVLGVWGIVLAGRIPDAGNETPVAERVGGGE